MQRKANEKRLEEFKQELLIFSNGCINKTVNVKFLSDTQKTQTSQCQFFDLVANHPLTKWPFSVLSLQLLYKMC